MVDALAGAEKAQSPDHPEVILRQKTALASLMFDPYGSAFDSLSERCKAELHRVYERLSAGHEPVPQASPNCQAPTPSDMASHACEELRDAANALLRTNALLLVVQRAFNEQDLDRRCVRALMDTAIELTAIYAERGAAEADYFEGVRHG